MPIETYFNDYFLNAKKNVCFVKFWFQKINTITILGCGGEKKLRGEELIWLSTLYGGKTHFL